MSVLMVITRLKHLYCISSKGTYLLIYYKYMSNIYYKYKTKKHIDSMNRIMCTRILIDHIMLIYLNGKL